MEPEDADQIERLDKYLDGTARPGKKHDAAPPPDATEILDRLRRLDRSFAWSKAEQERIRTVIEARMKADPNWAGNPWEEAREVDGGHGALKATAATPWTTRTHRPVWRWINASATILLVAAAFGGFLLLGWLDRGADSPLGPTATVVAGVADDLGTPAPPLPTAPDLPATQVATLPATQPAAPTAIPPTEAVAAADPLPYTCEISEAGAVVPCGEVTLAPGERMVVTQESPSQSCRHNSTVRTETGVRISPDDGAQVVVANSAESPEARTYTHFVTCGPSYVGPVSGAYSVE